MFSLELTLGVFAARDDGLKIRRLWTSDHEPSFRPIVGISSSFIAYGDSPMTILDPVTGELVTIIVPKPKLVEASVRDLNHPHRSLSTTGRAS